MSQTYFQKPNGLAQLGMVRSLNECDWKDGEERMLQNKSLREWVCTHRPSFSPDSRWEFTIKREKEDSLAATRVTEYWVKDGDDYLLDLLHTEDITL